MDNNYQIAEMGEPDLQLAGLQLWIHGRQFPESKDYWDGNWLKVTARCCASGADVWASGPIIHLEELHRWMVGIETMSLWGEANLDCMEPNLSIKMKITELGQIDMRVSITPEHDKQEHCFQFEIEQSYLPQVIESLRTIFQNFPSRGS